MGTADLLFPPGCSDIRELPAQLFDAIRTSLMFLGFEEMPEEDSPPKRIWLDNDALTAHFAQLKAKRKAEMDPKASTVPDTPMEQNTLAKDMIVG